MRATPTLLLLALASPAYASVAGPTIADPSFETTRVQGFQYNPAGGAWTFEGLSGISANGGPFYAGTAPNGTQAAFLQTSPNGDASNPGRITTTLSGLTIGGTYVLSFFLASRPMETAATDAINVQIGNTDLGTFSNAATTFVQETTASFVATNSSLLLAFASSLRHGPTEQDAAIDQITIAQVPEPTTLALLATAALATLPRRRRT